MLCRMNDVVLGALIAAVPLALSNVVVYMQGKQAREHEAALERERRYFEVAQAQHADRRRRYAAFLSAAQAVSAFLEQSEATSNRQPAESLPRAEVVPLPLLERLADATADAVLDAPDELAGLIAEAHGRILDAAQLLLFDGPGYAEHRPDLNAVRTAMANDLT
jgi:hypothetical protein